MGLHLGDIEKTFLTECANLWIYSAHSVNFQLLLRLVLIRYEINVKPFYPHIHVL